MDVLVAKFSRPSAFRNEPFAEEEQAELFGASGPALSFKFAMPPVANVGLSDDFVSMNAFRDLLS